MATEASLKALSNSQLASGTEIPATKHRTVNDAIIEEMFLAQSRGDVLSGVQAAGSLAAGDKVFVIRSGQSYLLDADEFGFIDTLAALTDVNIPSPSNNQILKYDSATSKWVNIDISTLLPSSLVSFHSVSDAGTNPTAIDASSARELNVNAGLYNASTTTTLSNVSSLFSFTYQFTNTNANVITFAGITLYFKTDDLPSGVTFASNALTMPADSAVKYNLVGLKMDGTNFDCKIEIR